MLSKHVYLVDRFLNFNLVNTQWLFHDEEGHKHGKAYYEFLGLLQKMNSKGVNKELVAKR